MSWLLQQTIQITNKKIETLDIFDNLKISTFKKKMNGEL